MTVVSAFELGQCLHVRFVSFRFALKGFAWRQTAARCFTVSQSPKTLSCAPILAQEKDRVLRALFFPTMARIQGREHRVTRRVLSLVGSRRSDLQGAHYNAPVLQVIYSYTVVAVASVLSRIGCSFIQTAFLVSLGK